jgi:uncharacterized membrane protein
MFIIQLLVIVFQFAASLYFFPSLPKVMPTHWNVFGQIDGTMPKEFAAWMMPLLGLFILTTFKLAPMFDPKNKKYHLFSHEWNIIQTVFVLFMAYMQGITFYAAYFPATQIMKPMFIGMGILFVLLGNYLSKIRQNYFIGIKVPWTLDNEDNWNKTHRFASWTFVLMGLIVFAEGFLIWNAAPIIFGSIMLAATLPILYSYLLFKKKERYMKYILIAVAVLIGGLLLIRVISGEDGWICKNGKWVQHGKPSAVKPTTTCIK